MRGLEIGLEIDLGTDLGTGLGRGRIEETETVDGMIVGIEEIEGKQAEIEAIEEERMTIGDGILGIDEIGVDEVEVEKTGLDEIAKGLDLLEIDGRMGWGLAYFEALAGSQKPGPNLKNVPTPALFRNLSTIESRKNLNLSNQEFRCLPPEDWARSLKN